MICIKFRFIFLSLLFSSSICGQKISSNNWNDYIAFYRKFGSPLVGGNCQMLPSCSKYADLQFSTNNAFAAFLNTSDRLIRCSHDVKNYQVLATTSGYKFIDFPTDSLNKINSPKWNEVNFASVDVLGSKNELFIENLINRNFYSEALLEINRVLFEKDKNQLSLNLYVNYIRCLRSLGMYERVGLDYETIVPLHFANSPKIRFEVARSYIALGNLEKANELITKIAHDSTLDASIRDEANIILSIIFAKKYNWVKAKQVLLDVNSTGRYAKNASDNLIFIEKQLAFQPKKPWKAGLLSVVPGLGYVYSKSYMSGISALAINSLLGFATYSCFKSGNDGLGILTGIISMGFYFGNIKGAKENVNRYNNFPQENTANKIILQFSN
jgi:putative component of membrane protein insertase Oxa1/YidC/SpoIIIJ protein YidD